MVTFKQKNCNGMGIKLGGTFKNLDRGFNDKVTINRGRLAHQKSPTHVSPRRCISIRSNCTNSNSVKAEGWGRD
jgi:hypothetical protein